MANRSKASAQPGQMLLEWSTHVATQPSLADRLAIQQESSECPPAEGIADARGALPSLSAGAAAIIHAHLPSPLHERFVQACDGPPVTSTPTGPVPTPLVQVLPWDFRVTFPAPLEEAIEAGKINEDDIDIESLKSLHEEHARYAVMLLSDLDAVLDARRRGVDPTTGRLPSSQKQKERLEQMFSDEPKRLEHAFEVLMDVYEEAFGGESADAFRKAIRAWHAGVEVVSEEPPLPSPLLQSIEAGVFGNEEDGAVVNPTDQEVKAITEQLADELIELSDGPRRQELLSKYADDFGAVAAQELDRWSRLKPKAEEHEPVQHDPGHPWHYYYEGDGAEPIPLEAIPTPNTSLDRFGVKWPKNPAKRRTLMQQLLDSQRNQLVEDEKRYQALIDSGVDALSGYDREIAHGGNDDLAWASAIALKYTHIGQGRGRIRVLEEALGYSAPA